MTRVWSYRPQILHLALFFAAYLLGCGFAKVLGIVPGTNIAIWPPGGLFMATLILTSPYSWPWWALSGCLAEMLAQFLWWGSSPLPAALLIYAGNALEAAAGAWLLNLFFGRPIRLETLQEVLGFVVLGAGIAPLVSATVGSATLAWFGVKSQTFAGAWPLWWIGDATGILLIAPLVLVVLQNWHGKDQLSATRWIEACVVGLIILAVAALSLSGHLPFAYIIMPPLLWAAVRFEVKGAVVTLTLLALITTVFTIHGGSQFAGDADSQRQKQIMLQLFLAISASSALIVAAISRQHQQALATLRESERSLREREAKIRRLVDSDIIGIVIWDLDGRLIDANDAFLRVVQYERKDLQAGLRWFDMTPPEWQDAHARYEAEELKTTGMMQAREKEFFRKDGSRVPVLIGAACFEGQSRQGVAYILDLTERKRAEAALRDRERELAQLVDMLPVYIRRLTPEGEPIFFNKRLTDFIGVDLAEIGADGTSRLRPAIESFVHPDEAANVVAALRRAVATGEDYAMRYRMRGADGAYRWIETRAEPLRNQDGTIAQWYSVSIDIEDEVRAQQAEEALRETSGRLAKATQSASLAELSASIAHEVNQPLAAIVANSHACQRWLTAEPPNIDRAQKTVERVIRDANSAADVVSRIRALFKQSVDTRNATLFGVVVTEARDLVAEEAVRHRVRIDIDVENDLPPVPVDRVQIQQVLINLMRNGMESMDSASGDRVLVVRARRVGDIVQTEISDCGRGVERPERIFEPFFTTKEQGMGMGLAICRSIVESHGGRLWMEKNQPHGSTFVFTLPVEAKAAS